jgi:hypothetical protein
MNIDDIGTEIIQNAFQPGQRESLAGGPIQSCGKKAPRRAKELPSQKAAAAERPRPPGMHVTIRLQDTAQNLMLLRQPLRQPARRNRGSAVGLMIGEEKNTHRRLEKG